MKGETYLYFSDELAGTENDTIVCRASDFQSMEIGGAALIDLFFKSGEAYTTKAADIRLAIDTLATGASNTAFKDACRVFSGCLNHASGKMLVVADEKNSVYVEPFKGAVAVDDVN
tara:strand:- start:1497 stop:1844 length:348 start_codon:yes stop_codon:yes gene_type:complete